MTLKQRLFFLPILVALACVRPEGRMGRAGTLGKPAQQRGRTGRLHSRFQKLLEVAGEAGGGVVEVLRPVPNQDPPFDPRQRHAGRHLPCGASAGERDRPGIWPARRRPRLRGARLHECAALYPPRRQQRGHLRLRAITYPEWKQADVPPVPYPPCVLCEGKEDVGGRETASC